MGDGCALALRLRVYFSCVWLLHRAVNAFCSMLTTTYGARESGGAPLPAHFLPSIVGTCAAMLAEVSVAALRRSGAGLGPIHTAFSGVSDEPPVAGKARVAFWMARHA